MSTFRKCTFIVLLISNSLSAQSNTNLLVNPGAESGNFDGWTTASAPRILRYDGAGEQLNNSSPVPEGDKGIYYFMGGSTGASTSMFQTVDLQGIINWESGSAYSFDLSAWLGGWYIQDDHAIISVTFNNAANEILGTYTLDTVTSVERNSVTMMLEKGMTDEVPFGSTTATINVDYVFVHGGYDNDAYVDNLWFSIGSAIIPEPSSYALSLAGICGVLIFIRRRR